MLTKAGADRSGAPQVKLLDFGLAKLREPDAEHVLKSSVATRQALTVQGTIVGTLPYMAPEQMSGQVVDARSDLFSFGAVLYEMVTGRRAFGGDTPAAVMASVIGGQPASPRSVRPDIPAGLERLIITCLAKDPADRWQSAHDVALFLDSPEDPVAESARARPRRSPWIAGSGLRRRRRDRTGSGLGTGIPRARGHACATGAAVDSPRGRRTARSPPPARVQAPAWRSHATAGAWSTDQDGTAGACSSSARSTAPKRPCFAGRREAFGPFFSPDGNWVAFFTESALKKVPLDGGGPVTICATPPVSRGGSWADDDTIYFTPDFTSGVQRVAAAGGRPQDVTTVDLAAKESNHLFPEVLPGGEVVLFTVWKGGTFDAASTWAFSTRTGKRTLLIEGASEARYLPQGYLVFARAGTLFAVPFDAKTLALLGAATPVVEGVWNDPATGTAHYAVSHTGTLVYAPGQYTDRQRPDRLGRPAWRDRVPALRTGLLQRTEALARRAPPRVRVR